jgi:peptidoglycan/xylan/chitin deacetylase (PgdA/CDA1 family)
VSAATRRAAIARIAAVAYRTRLITLAARVAGVGRRRVPILIYHRVNNERDPYFPSLPTAVFERHMAYVARAYRVLPLDEVVERLARGESLPPNALAMTFDDGYRDNLTHAAPILARHRLPATVFLATGFIGTPEVPWFDRVAAVLKTTAVPRFTAPWGQVVSLTTQADRLATVERCQTYFKSLSYSEFVEQLEVMVRALGIDEGDAVKNEMLSWDDVHALRGVGCSIGAHTMSHPILSRMSEAQAAREIGGSRDMIEAACGIVPRAFAYPNGQPQDYTHATMRLVRESGFDYAVSTRFGLNDRETSLWELRRGGPSEHDVATFALKLAWYRLTLSDAGSR